MRNWRVESSGYNNESLFWDVHLKETYRDIIRKLNWEFLTQAASTTTSVFEAAERQIHILQDQSSMYPFLSHLSNSYANTSLEHAIDIEKLVELMCIDIWYESNC